MKTKYNKIVLNIPHSSENICDVGQYTDYDLLREDILQMTDWFTDKLFESTMCESVVFPYSRFYCDVERLNPDPEQEAKGQGIIYTHSICGERLRRKLTKEQRDRVYSLYKEHREILGGLVSEGDLLIDCHSFSDEYVGSSDVDICIGYNDDDSKPDDQTLNAIKECFAPWRVAFNTPFSNSITPRPDFDYKSVMIEVNKRLYMDIVDGRPIYRENSEVREAILRMYSILLNQ